MHAIMDTLKLLYPDSPMSQSKASGPDTVMAFITLGDILTGTGLHLDQTPAINVAFALLKEHVGLWEKFWPTGCY
jgi:hypothetical protein